VTLFLASASCPAARVAIEVNQQVGDNGEVDDNSEADDPQE
jgi:hypothetical protein